MKSITIIHFLVLAAISGAALADTAFCPQGADPAYCELAKSSGGAAVACPKGPGAKTCLSEAIASANPIPAPEPKRHPFLTGGAHL